MKAQALTGLARPFTLLAPAVGVTSGALVAQAATSAALRPSRLALGIVAALLVTAASNAWNQVYDVELDRINKPHRPLPAGRVTPRQALLFGHLTALTGMAAAYFVGPAFFACVTIGVFSTWIYSAPPLRTKRHPAGALLTIAIPRGLLVPVAGWAVVAAPRSSEPWALGVVSGLFVLGAAVTKDFADVEGDSKYGCRTLPAVWGARVAAFAVAPFLVLPFLLYPVFGALGWLQPPLASLCLLSGCLTGLGLMAAYSLLRDPSGMLKSGGNHPAWAVMYLLLLGAHIGCALVYQLTL